MLKLDYRHYIFIVYLSLILAGCSQTTTSPPNVTINPVATHPLTPTLSPEILLDTEYLIYPSYFEYRGAFQLPEGEERPLTFEYGGNAMTYFPDGDATGSADGYPGSLFITGHDRLSYGELPDGSQIAEISIPPPLTAGHPSELPISTFLQSFENVTKGYFTGMDEIPRIGIAYANTSETGPKIHICWGQHMPPEISQPTHAVFDVNLRTANFQGGWYIGNQSDNSTNGYLFTIPQAWAEKYTEGKYIATGRFRDGGWSGMGPSLFAYNPWDEIKGSLAANGTRLKETILLLYQNSMENDSIEGALHNYQHPDEWEGGAWLTTKSGASAVVFAGTKATGSKYWYGYVNNTNPEEPCVEGEMVGDFTLCRLADGSPCPSKDLVECNNHNSYRGWWSNRFDAQIIFYNPDDLAQVADGRIPTWEPQPYAVMDIDDQLFLNPDDIEQDMLGSGNQRRMRVGAVAYDASNQLFYLLELYAKGASPVVHVWHIDG